MTQQHDTNTPTPIVDLDGDVSTYLDLTDRIDQLVAQRDTVKARLAQRGVGDHTTRAGVTVKVTAPPRRFNMDRAWAMLNADQRALCSSPDAKKVRSQLSSVLLEQCMDDVEDGAPRVSIR